jgi:hypothetical protein
LTAVFGGLNVVIILGVCRARRCDKNKRLTEIAWNQIEATNDFKYGAIGREIRMESAA